MQVMIKELILDISEFDVKNFDFILQLQALKANQELNGQFAIELEKGSRFLQTINQNIELTKQQEYIFKEKKQIALKAFKQKNMVFDLSIYMKKKKLLEFIDSFKINLQNCYINFTNELKPYYSQYKKIGKLKQSRVQHENWKKIKSNLKTHESKHVLASTDGKFILQYTIQIRNQYDTLFDEQPNSSWKTKKQKQLSTSFSEKSIQSRNSLCNNRNKSMLIQKTHSLKKSQSTPKINSLSQDNQKSESNNKNYLTQIPHSGSKLKVKTALSHIIEASNQTQIVYYSDKKKRNGNGQGNARLNVKRNKSLSYTTKAQENELTTVVQQKMTSSLIQSQRLQQNAQIEDSSPPPFKTKYVLIFIIIYLVLCFMVEQRLQTKEQLLKTSQQIDKQEIYWKR